MFGLRFRLAIAMRRASLLAGGVALCLIGVVCLTVSSWIALASSLGGAGAGVLIAMIYIGLGLIMLGAARVRYRAAAPAVQTAADVPTLTALWPSLVQAYILGQSVARRSKD